MIIENDNKNDNNTKEIDMDISQIIYNLTQTNDCINNNTNKNINVMSNTN